jgi:hypothetical protein
MEKHFCSNETHFDYAKKSEKSKERDDHNNDANLRGGDHQLQIFFYFFFLKSNLNKTIIGWELGASFHAAFNNITVEKFAVTSTGDLSHTKM